MSEATTPEQSFWEGTLKLPYDIEKASRLKVSGIVNNSNLGCETDRQALLAVEEKVRNLSLMTGIPVKFRTVDERFKDDFPDDMHIRMVTKKLW